MITACAALERDPLIRESFQLQAAEETRHAGIIRHLIGRYGLHAGEATSRSRPTWWRRSSISVSRMLRFVRRLRSLPARPRARAVSRPPLRHLRARHGGGGPAHRVLHQLVCASPAEPRPGRRVLRHPKALWHYGKALRKLIDLVRDDDGPEGQDFSSRGRNPSSMTSRQCSCCRVAWRRTSAAWRASIDACSCRVSGRPSRESPWASRTPSGALGRRATARGCRAIGEHGARTSV